MNKKLNTSLYCERVTDGTHATPKPSDTGKHLVTSRHIRDGILDLSESYLISLGDFEDVNKRSKVEQWDILFSMIGTVGEIYIERSETPDYAIKNLGLFKMNGDKYKALKLYYYLRSPYFQKKLKFWLSGSIQSFVPLHYLRNIELPDLNSISNNVIGEIELLQKKIVLNNNLIYLLEEYSRILFYKWFIDFNFPDENELDYKDNGGKMCKDKGKIIPMEWESGELKDICKISSGKRISGIKEEKNDIDVFPVYGASEIMGYTDKHLYKGPIIVTGRVGTHGIVMKEYGDSWPTDNTLVIQSKYDVFIYYMIKVLNLKKMNTGSIQPLITQTDLNRRRIVIPNDKVIKRFEEKISIFEDKIRMLKNENHLLQETHDLLIKKLIK